MRSADIVEASGARPPAPRHRPRRARPARGRARALPHHDRRVAVRGARTTTFPADWEAQVAAWQRPRPAEVFELVFTSGTTGNPKGVMLAHDNVLAGRAVVPRDHQADGAPDRVAAPAVARARAGRVACSTRWTSARTSCTSGAGTRGSSSTASASTGSRRCSSCPQVLDLFWSAIEREVEKQGKTATVRAPAVDRPAPAVRGATGAVPERPLAVRRRPAAVRDRRRVPAARAPAGVGGHGRHRPPGLRRDRDGRGLRDDDGRPPDSGCVGWPPKPVEMRIVEDGEIQFRGPTPHPRATGTTRRPRRRRSPRTAGTSRATSAARREGPAPPPRAQEGHHRAAQRVQRVPRGHRERAAGRRDPGLGGGRDAARADRGRRARARDARGARATHARRRRSRPPRPRSCVGRSTPRSRPRTASLGPNQRIAGWRVWPEADFPRTHTFKVKRDRVRAWAADRRSAAGAEGS